MNLPHAAWVSEIINADDEKICVKQDLASVTQISEIPYPCLITVEKDICVPRLPSYLLKKATQGKPVRILSLEELLDQDLSRYGLDRRHLWSVCLRRRKRKSKFISMEMPLKKRIGCFRF